MAVASTVSSRQDFWNWIELIILLLLLVSVSMMLYRFYLLAQLSKTRRSLRKLDYISFHDDALFEEVRHMQH